MILSKACKTKMAAFLLAVMALAPVQAITQEEMKESVFTNIDGAVFL